MSTQPAALAREHDPAFRDVRGLEFIDSYRVLELFGVKAPAICAAVDLLLHSGQSGDPEERVAQAVGSLLRWQEMRDEDAAVAEAQQPDGVRKSCGNCGNYSLAPAAAITRSKSCSECLLDPSGIFAPTKWVPFVPAEARGDKDAC